MNDKYSRLIGMLRDIESAVLAFSGGVDSSFLLRALKDSGIRTLAVTASSATMPEADCNEAEAIAITIGAPFRKIETSELDDPDFIRNPRERCYYCKKRLFRILTDIAADEGYAAVLDGSNYDDLGDWRPGLMAAKEYGVKSPLVDAGFTKSEIRSYSKELGLPTWAKPSSPCLASRFPYGTPITKEGLRRVAEAETFLKDLGFAELRVRSHPGDIARIELPKHEIQIIFGKDMSGKISEKFRKLGYKYITVDIDGFRSGNLND